MSYINNAMKEVLQLHQTIQPLKSLKLLTYITQMKIYSTSERQRKSKIGVLIENCSSLLVFLHALFYFTFHYLLKGTNTDTNQVFILYFLHSMFS